MLDTLRNVALIISPIVAALVAWTVAKININHDKASRSEGELKKKIAKVRGFSAEIDDFKSILENKQSDISHACERPDELSSITFSDLAAFTSIRLPEVADYIEDEDVLDGIKSFRQDIRDLQDSLERYVSPKCSEDDLTVFDKHFDAVVAKADALKTKVDGVRTGYESALQTIR